MTEIRTVIDPAPTVGGTRCLKPVGDSVCWFRSGHAGTCLPIVGPRQTGRVGGASPRQVEES